MEDKVTKLLEHIFKIISSEVRDFTPEEHVEFGLHLIENATRNVLAAPLERTNQMSFISDKAREDALVVTLDQATGLIVEAVEMGYDGCGFDVIVEIKANEGGDDDLPATGTLNH